MIDDVVREADLKDFLPYLGGRIPRKVLLAPTLEELLRRNRERANKSFDTRVLEPVSTRLHASLVGGCPPEDGWVVIDSTGQEVGATVETILGAFDAGGERRP